MKVDSFNGNYDSLLIFVDMLLNHRNQMLVRWFDYKLHPMRHFFNIWKFSPNILGHLYTVCVDGFLFVHLINRELNDIRCIVFVERVVTAVVLQSLLSELLPRHCSWRTEYIAGNNTGLQSQSRNTQNEIVEEFRKGMVCKTFSYFQNITFIVFSVLIWRDGILPGEHHHCNIDSWGRLRCTKLQLGL